MEHWLDDVARTVASGVSRRQALRRIGGGFAAAMMTSLGLAPKAEAAGRDKADTHAERHPAKGNADTASPDPKPAAASAACGSGFVACGPTGTCCPGKCCNGNSCCTGCC